MTTQPLTSDGQINKPLALRAIFILNALMMILPFIFYFVVTTNGIDLGGLDPQLMIYTGIAYILSFGALVFSILKKNIMLARAIFLINILIALPASAYIGIVVAIISLAISFFSSRVKAYFTN